MPGDEKPIFDYRELDKSIDGRAISERLTAEIARAIKPFAQSAKAGFYPLCDVAKTIVWVGFYLMSKCADPREIESALNEILVEVEKLGRKEH